MIPERTGPPSVLIVDDDQEINDIVGMILESRGYRVRSAENGREALAAVRKSTPDLVLLDLMMPVMTGVEFLEEMRKDPALANVPVLILSAWAEHAVDLPNVAGIVCKPFQLKDLLGQIEKSLQESHATQWTSPPR
jgi:CheY-like chemotaxis protein